MEDREWRDFGVVPARWTQDEYETLAQPSILLVEDDDDIRELMMTMLQLAGCAPVPCVTAEQALNCLREQDFDLVLTDYMLPGRTGGWLLRQASSEGLLDATPALVVTAHPNPGDVAGFETVCKPFDLEDLVGRVKRRLAEGGTPRRPGRARKQRSSQTGSNGNEDAPDPVELILYVTAHSPQSAEAIENIRRVLSRNKPSTVKLTIHDLTEGLSRERLEQGSLTAQPRSPRTFILGHITNPELLLELLEGYD